jgi:hypothetical protein
MFYIYKFERDGMEEECFYIVQQGKGSIARYETMEEAEEALENIRRNLCA